MAVETSRYVTNQPYRLVTEEDLIPGTEMIQVRLDAQGRRPDPATGRVFDSVDPRIPNQVVRIESVDDRYVIYRLGDAGPWTGARCWVQRENFLDPDYPAGIFIVAMTSPVPA